jgi:hypothetical protein
MASLKSRAAIKAASLHTLAISAPDKLKQIHEGGENETSLL